MMKTHSTIGKIIYFIGLILFISGFGRYVGSFDYNSFISNEFVALIYIFIGNTIILASCFLKIRTD